MGRERKRNENPTRSKKASQDEAAFVSVNAGTEEPLALAARGSRGENKTLIFIFLACVP